MVWNTQEIPGLYLAALCCWREARGETIEGWRGVLHVIKNRADCPSWWGHSLASVVLQPEQFSSFNHGDPNADKFPRAEDGVFIQMLEMAARVVSDRDEDLTEGATHYHARDVFPPWATKMQQTVVIGNHTFYK